MYLYLSLHTRRRGGRAGSNGDEQNEAYRDHWYFETKLSKASPAGGVVPRGCCLTPGHSVVAMLDVEHGVPGPMPR